LDIHSIDRVCQDEEDIPIDPAARGFRIRRVREDQGVYRLFPDAKAE
jgi:hypothetical protein